MWNYSDRVFDHFVNPRNVGEIENPDGVGEVGSMACGDALRLAFCLDEEGKIAEAKFQTFGCGSAIASSSILTEMILGLSLADAAKVTNEDIANELGGLPREKMHCSVMGREALEAAMIDYFKKQGREIPCELLSKSPVICGCFQVTKETITKAVMDNRLQTIEDVTSYTKAGGGCNSCHHEIRDILAECQEKLAAETDNSGLVQLDSGKPVAVDFDEQDKEVVAKIQDLIDQDISVALRNDGGDLEFVRYRDNKVFVKLIGACAACPASDATIQGYVQATLREFINDDIEVVEVKA